MHTNKLNNESHGDEKHTLNQRRQITPTLERPWSKTDKL